MVSLVTIWKTSRKYRMVTLLTIKFFVLKPRWSVYSPFETRYFPTLKYRVVSKVTIWIIFFQRWNTAWSLYSPLEIVTVTKIPLVSLLTIQNYSIICLLKLPKDHSLDENNLVSDGKFHIITFLITTKDSRDFVANQSYKIGFCIPIWQ